MKRILLAIVCAGAIFGAYCLAQAGTIEQASQLELKGQFKEAATALTQALKDQSLPSVQRKQMEFELDRLERIRRDYPFTEESLFARLKNSVEGLTEAEYQQWVREGRFDSRDIDGKRRFMGSSVANLFFRYQELASRRHPPKDNGSLAKARYECCMAIRNAAQSEKKPYVLPKRFHITMTVAAKPDAAPEGEVIRAWLPIPRHTPFQDCFEVLKTSPPVKSLADEQSPIRSAYFEQAANKGKATAFSIEYNYTIHGVCFDPKPSEVAPGDPSDPALKVFTQEAPHVVFTPEMRALSKEIVGAETNPCLKAKKCYDWIAGHIKYSFATEYSTIRNISDYCRSKGYGDCGQEAMLFITLCRLNGVPARWQTGWDTFPQVHGIHDWCVIYLAPYGWMPVDPCMGVLSMRYSDSLTPAQRRELRDFYFGGLDQYRIIVNSDHSQTLSPPKQSMRSDNVDFQRGELECGRNNIYFNRYSFRLALEEMKVPAP